MGSAVVDVVEASWVGLVEFASRLDPDPQFEGLSDEDVERQVREGASRIAALQCEWLLHLAEFVVRGGWAEGGARTPGQWLSWACGVAGSTGREYVRVALALRHLPVIRGRFAVGTLSYSKVRAITRVAVPEIERELVDLADRAQRAQARQLEVDEAAEPSGDERDEGQAPRLSRGARRAVAICDAVATAVAAGGPDRSGVDDHLVVLHVDAHDLADAVTDATGDAAAAADPGGDAAGAGDEVAAMRRRRRARPGSPGRRARVASGRGRSMLLPRAVLARLACDGELRLAGIDGGGHPADIGRRSRKVPPDLRRVLQLRDRRCRFPGCEATRHLHAHHVVHWARGGPTDLANLVLLCGHHHRFVHDAGWQLRPVDPAAGRWTFHAPDRDGPVPAVWAMPGASAASLAQLTSGPPPPPGALQPPWWDGAGYDLDETLAMVTDWILDAA